MIEEIFNTLSLALYESYWIAVAASFGWGVLSIILSPCHLSSIPLVVGYITSQGEISTRRTFNISFIFSIGILVTIAIIGVITAFMGRIMGDVGSLGNYLVASIFFIVGLYLLDIIRLPWDAVSLKSTKLGGLSAAFVLGLLFGIGLGPCTFAFLAPVLGVVFQEADTSLIAASLLLLAFGIGHCAVIVVAGTMTNKVQQYLNWTEASKTTVWVKRICGVLVILGGVYFLYTA